MEKTRTFEELEVWKIAHVFTLEVYKVTEAFPKNELFGLVSQLRRASVSITVNIAEGYKKKGKSDKLRLFYISRGSMEECRYYIILGKDLNYFGMDVYSLLIEKLEQTSRLLSAYCHSISHSQNKLDSLTSSIN